MNLKIFFFLIFSGIRLYACTQTTINPSKIDIVRDSFGVPHIFAKTDAEVATD
jgi:acyl-homoserine lactone acylase PvdQ